MKPIFDRRSAGRSSSDRAEDEAMDSPWSDSSSARSSQSTSPVKLEPQQPRLPGLSLNLGGLARLDDASPSARPANAKPALSLGLRLPLAASATIDAPLTSRRRPQEPSQPLPEQRTATMAVDLLSPAFSLLAQQSDTQLQQQCADRLGVAPDSLRYYALVDAASLADLPPNCERVAVAVAGSSFSLEAMEQLLRENRELAAVAAAGDSDVVHEHRSLKEQIAASKQIAKVAQARVAKVESALQKEQAERKGLQQEAVLLRRQLKRSEELRQRGQRALDDLKHEFDALQRELVFEPPAALLSTPQPLAGSVAASPMASTPGEAPAQPDRLAELLGRLCESTTLDKLEQLVNRLQT